MELFSVFWKNMCILYMDTIKINHLIDRYVEFSNDQKIGKTIYNFLIYSQKDENIKLNRMDIDHTYI
jgi:hypothetical protein